MIVNCFSYNLQNSGTLQDYAYGLWLMVSTYSTYWEIDSVTTTSGLPSNSNITEVVVRLKSDTSKKIKLTPRAAVSTRGSSLQLEFSDGVTPGWEGKADNYSPNCYIDGYITASLGRHREFDDSVRGAQNVTGLKGADFIETSDMLSMVVYGRGVYSSNWQFGFQAGRIWEAMSSSRTDGWGIMAGNPCASGQHAADPENTSGWFGWYFGAWPTAQGTQSFNDFSDSRFVSWGGMWMGVQLYAANSTLRSQYVGDWTAGAGSVREALTPFIMRVDSVRARQTNFHASLLFTRYCRSARLTTLDTLYNSPFNATVAWRLQYPDVGATFQTATTTIAPVTRNNWFIWSQSGSLTI